MIKKIVWAAILLILSCVVLLFGIWTDSNWLSTALALLVFALGGFLLVSLYRADQHEKETRRTLAEDLDRANRDKEEYRKACMEEQAQFFSTFSHGVRMPLSIIKGYAELLLSGDIDRESEPQYLEKIIERSQSIVDFFPKIQDRLELKELQEEKREPVDLLQLVRDCTQEIKNGMCFDTIRIQVLSQEDSLLILSSPERINEIIYNLLENAAKYMQRQGIVTFRLWKDLGMVHMHVRDDGMGLKKEEASRIFEKNYQGSNQKGGRGYGLYWVQQIVLAHGGRIWAESDIGKGMSIQIVFPEFRPQADEKLAAS